MTPPTVAGGLAWEALDSRGRPTVGCELRLESGAAATATVPSGASTGRYEAHELRDGGVRFGGLGVTRAVEHVNSTVIPALTGRGFDRQDQLDAALRELDGTPNLERIGANAVLAVSVAWALANARERGLELYQVATAATPLLPLPMVNVLSGGAHAGGALDVQDVLVVPLVATSFAAALEHVARVRAAAVRVAAEAGLPTALVADEGGLGLGLPGNREALQLVTDAIEAAGFEPGVEIAIAIDIAANQLESDGGYRFALEDRTLSSTALIRELGQWCREFPIVSIEDPLSDQDWTGWEQATAELPGIQLVGDDLFATNPDRVRKGVDRRVASAVLIKPNQIGTLSQAEQVTAMALASGYAAVVSARSGDTEDSWLADLAVAWGAAQIKVGSLTRSERLAKWNRLLQIEAREGDRATYAGASALVRVPSPSQR
jgi:enolase 1/2/3